MLSWSQWLNSAGTSTRGGGTPARGAGMAFRFVPGEFNRWLWILLTDWEERSASTPLCRWNTRNRYMDSAVQQALRQALYSTEWLNQWHVIVSSTIARAIYFLPCSQLLMIWQPSTFMTWLWRVNEDSHTGTVPISSVVSCRLTSSDFAWNPASHCGGVQHQLMSQADWQSATVVNSSLVEHPTIRLPGFDLHRRQWSLLNRFRTGQLGPLQCVPQEMGFHWERIMCLWWNPNNVTYRQLLSIDQVRRWTRGVSRGWPRVAIPPKNVVAPVAP